MKTLLTSLVVILFISSAAFGKEGHQHGMDKNEGHSMQCGMNMMNHEQKMAMHQRMQEMKKTMKKIQLEKDPKQREKLMQEQMGHMEEHMTMMGKMMKDKNEVSSGHKHKGE